jgi:hypothetical protein
MEACADISKRETRQLSGFRLNHFYRMNLKRDGMKMKISGQNLWKRGKKGGEKNEKQNP